MQRSDQTGGNYPYQPVISGPGQQLPVTVQATSVWNGAYVTTGLAQGCSVSHPVSYPPPPSGPQVFHISSVPQNIKVCESPQVYLTAVPPPFIPLDNTVHFSQPGNHREVLLDGYGKERALLPPANPPALEYSPAHCPGSGNVQNSEIRYPPEFQPEKHGEADKTTDISSALNPAAVPFVPPAKKGTSNIEDIKLAEEYTSLQAVEGGAEGKGKIDSERKERGDTGKVKKKKKKKKTVNKSSNGSQQLVASQENCQPGAGRRELQGTASVTGDLRRKEGPVRILCRSDAGSHAFCDDAAGVGEILPVLFEILADDFHSGSCETLGQQFEHIVGLLDKEEQSTEVGACHLHLLTSAYIKLDELYYFSPGRDVDWVKCAGLPGRLQKIQKKAKTILTDGLKSCLEKISAKNCHILLEVINMIVRERCREFDLGGIGNSLFKLSPFLDQVSFVLLAKIAVAIGRYNDVGFETKMAMIGSCYNSFLTRVKAPSSTLNACSSIADTFDCYFGAYCALQLRCKSEGFVCKDREFQGKLQEITSEKATYAKAYQDKLETKIKEKQQYLDDLQSNQEDEAEKSLEIDLEGQASQTNRAGFENVGTPEVIVPSVNQSECSHDKPEVDSVEKRFGQGSELFRKREFAKAKKIFEAICREKERSNFYYYSKVELIQIALQEPSYRELLKRTKTVAEKSKQFYSDYKSGFDNKSHKVISRPQDLEELSGEVSRLCDALTSTLAEPMKYQLYVLSELKAKSMELNDSGQELLTESFLSQIESVRRGYNKMKSVLEAANLANVSTQQAFELRSCWLKTLPKPRASVTRAQGVREGNHFSSAPKEHLRKLQEGAEKVDSLLSCHNCVLNAASALMQSEQL